MHVDNTTRHEVTHVHLTQHIVYGAPAAPQQQQPAPGGPGRYANEAQRKVLRLLVSIGPKETAVLDFCEREFGTRKIIDLNDAQLHRTQRYIETIQRRTPVPTRSTEQSRVQHHEFL